MTELQDILAQVRPSDRHIMGAMARILQPDLALDIGTQSGDSALQMAQGGAKRVLTFDVTHYASVPPGFPGAKQVIFLLDDLTNSDVAERHAEAIGRASLVYIDVDPHDGIKEPLILANLLRHQGRDLVIGFDDIHMNEGMDKLWSTLKADEKIEAPWAHTETGFGLALFKYNGTDTNTWENEGGTL